MSTISIFGEVLFDVFPNGERILGGAPFNVAWHLQAFGLQPQFISRIGQDESGQLIREAMHNWGMLQTTLQQDAQYPTGTVTVDFERGEPSYQILEHQAYDFIAAEPLTTLNTGTLLYHGSLALRSAQSCQTLMRLKQHHQGQVFIDVNLRAPWWQAVAVHEWLRHADWVKVNEEEWFSLYPETKDLTQAMVQAIKDYHWQGVVVTQGERGALGMNQQEECIQITPNPNGTVVDTVGAGDAFSAVLLLGLQKNWPLATTMQRAQQFASALVEKRGATVLDNAFYQAFIQAWAL